MTPTLSTTTWTPAAARPDLTPAAVTAALGDLTWTELPTPGGPAACLATGCRLAEVTRTAAGATVAGRDLIGVETVEPGGRTRILAVTDPAAADPAAVLVVVAVEFTPHR